MPPQINPAIKRRGRSSPAVIGKGRWKLEDAKARLSEVVRLAATNGPQLVTVRGKEAAVIVAAEEYKQLLPKPKGQFLWFDFCKAWAWTKSDIAREDDTGREIAL